MRFVVTFLSLDTLSEQEATKMENTKTNQAWLALRATFGLVPVAAGLDKFFNLLTQWDQYLSPVAKAVLPLSDVALMRSVGIVEIAVGLMILTKWTRIGAYVAAAWLTLIAVNLLMSGRFFDIAARDLALAVGAFALARLQEAREAGAVKPQRGIHTLGSPAHG
jgi:uncharacterized membrane protein YphA (DoxX/SURF4 family)